jgi:hypothetical protein
VRAVLNAVILASDDRHQGRTADRDATRRAFANLWQVRCRSGDQKGPWDSLDFGSEPWESNCARYHDADQAAIAVGTAHGYYTPGADADTEDRGNLLRGYLRAGLPGQDLYNRAWALWASTQPKGVLPKDEQQTIIRQRFDAQRDGGGWNLSSLGAIARRDGTTRESASDGYATGLVLHVLQTAGVPKDHREFARGLTWLKTNQAASGAWAGTSVNKNRDPATHVGEFRSNAATAHAVLALATRN